METYLGIVVGGAIITVICVWAGRRSEKPKPAAMRPVETVSERDLVEMFRHAPDSPTYKATLAVLDQQTVASVERSVDEGLTDQQMRYRLGGVAALLEFKQELEDRAAQARRTEQQEREQEK